MTTKTPEAQSVRPTWIDEARLASWTRWVACPVSGGDGSLTASAPYDARPTAPVPSVTTADVAEAAAAARAAQPDWATLEFSDRAEVVLRFHDLLVERQDEVLDLIQWEMGKARFHAWQEILQVGSVARHYAKRGSVYLADKRVRGVIPGVTAVKEIRVPKKVVGIISPWNYPLYLGVGDVIPALLAGSAVISKADPQTPLTLLWTRALMAEAGLPEHVWQVVTGPGAATGEAVIDNVDYIAFTGSTATGRIVAQRAAGRLIGSSLELGGKNPLIVRRDADLAQAARGTVTAAFANTGQMCVHIERVVVHEEVYDAFRQALVAETESQVVGQGFDYSADIGSLASEAQLEKITAHVTDAVAKGARVLAGGEPLPEVGPYAYAPTVLEDVTDEMDLCLGETFGPVVALYRAGSDEEAVRIANQGEAGLSASVFSKNLREADMIARRIRAGAVNINDGAALAVGSIEAGMGGMGTSGIGRRHGADGIRRFTDAQTLAVSRMGPIGPLKGQTLEKFVKLGNGQLKAMRKLGVR
ncbi:succinate-semialdehyde dehydrogenase/glutarate-semialdehyde dehydrogenase [Nocardioides luteus]|uniref:Succinic semialdehyde dehydrogenase n=1 Tax=Nocardioides luteus TaxID=1844 RepID=A0ABQ5SR89_9ACTN|nr:succinic semialdehyde dehydrogenase [Nocardioides luteus]MDR7311126.1 succinate-semialdehyde dehydrogenase/glutarate-semialdehyde dehydrogenase [Nocardioides luteus]GGR62458.1 succinic semialdehyde dehydrogenase [Nocardioides luteus]GLJ66672.1 succinic semialdehyde dehydrogenase [Nocardioides luteus]